MILFWRGRGIAVFFIFIAAMLLVENRVDAANGEGYYESHGWPKFVVGVIAAVPIFLLGNRWNASVNDTHDFMFIPMQFWAFLVIAIMSFVALWPSRGSAKRATEAAPEKTIEQPAPPPTRVEASFATPRPVETAPASPAPSTPVRAVAPAVTTTEEPVTRPVLRQVYVDRAARQYYPEDCKARPENTMKMARSVALQQGYTLAFECGE